MRVLAVALLTSTLVVTSAQVAEAKADFTVTVATSSSTSSVGGSFVLSGRVSPNAAGTSVKIQRRYARGSWTTIDTDKVGSASTYAIRIRPTRGGPTSYRVIKPSSNGRGGDISSTRVVDVFRWRYVTDLPVLAEGDVQIGTWSMKGSPFVKSVSIFGNPPVWDIGGLGCTKFRSFVGVDDRSPDSTTADSQVILDFAGANQETLAQIEELAWGKYPVYVQEAIPSGHSDIIFVGDADPNGGVDQDYLTYGSPQVYCNS